MVLVELKHCSSASMETVVLIKKSLIRTVPSYGTEDDTAVPACGTSHNMMPMGTATGYWKCFLKYLPDVIQTIYPLDELNVFDVKII